jgi:hypothetical protein
VTNYYGTVVSQENTANYSTCIGSCIAYNQESSPGACLAITFNGADDAATGLCTQFSDVSNVYLADEEGGENSPREQANISFAMSISPVETMPD